MQTAELGTGVQDGGKGFHPLYLWGIFYVLMTYGYPVLWFFTLPKADETVTSDAAYKELARAQNGALGENLPFVFLGIPIVLLLINIILAIALKKTGRRHFLNTARIIKYSLIPFFIMGGLLILAFFLFMFTPVVIMVFVSPMIMGALAVMGYISMVGSAPLVIAYLSKAAKDKKNGTLWTIVMTIMQFIFGLDVLGTILCVIKEKKHSR
ncbi:MAG: hypothetical protein E7295_15695 [Lachnospiraceae bacterium]|jgi:MFS family permease|nr:hypothetical protein [Lachnospiraceae bacterium]